MNWLKSGEQTKITSYIQKLANKFKNEKTDLEKIAKILIWIRKNIKEDKSKLKEFFRKRTSEQIIKSKFATGCTDFTLIFIPIARALNIPTKYIEGLDKRCTKNSKFNGHIVAKCFVNKRWIIADAQVCRIELDDKNFKKYFKIIGTGLDSWDLGIKDMLSIKKYIEKKIGN